MIWWAKLFCPNLSLVFPAYNEEHNIVQIIEQALPFIESHHAEIIVVDDGSTDQTALKVEQYAAYVTLVRHEKNKGYGAALRSGFAVARGMWVFFSDSDLQFRLSSLHQFWSYTHTFDVIIGYRHPRKDPLMRRINAWVWTALINRSMGLAIQDVNCAFKLFRREALEGIQLQAQGASINAELLSKLASYRLIQLPIEHEPRRQGTQTGAHPAVIVRALWELAFLLWGSDTEVPKP